MLDPLELEVIMSLLDVGAGRAESALNHESSQYQPQILKNGRGGFTSKVTEALRARLPIHSGQGYKS